MDLLGILKSATSPIHKQFEKMTLLKKILSNEISQEEYTRLLKIFYGFIKPCETNFKKRYPDLISGREKSPLLESDLNYDIDTPLCKELPKFDNEAHCYGYLYVMEGSTLGGQIITSHLKKNFRLSFNKPQTYFNAYGNETKNRWVQFTKLLITNNNTENQKSNLVENAIQTFTTLLAWMNNSSGE